MRDQGTKHVLHEGDRIRVTLSDRSTSITYLGTFGKLIPDGISMNGENEDTCAVTPDGCTQSVIVRLACVEFLNHWQ